MVGDSRPLPPTDPRAVAALVAPINGMFLRDDAQVVDADGWYRVLSPSDPVPAANEVVLSAVDEAAPDANIDAVVAPYRARELPLKWCVYPWSRPADLGERLLRRGAISWKARAMCASTTLSLSLPEGVTVEHVVADTVATYTDVMARAWEMPAPEVAFLHARLTELIALPEPAVHLVVARVGGEVAGSAATAVTKDSGYLMGASVLPELRGRGVYRALLQGRLRALRDVGMALATTHAREQTSAPMLEHLGFDTLFPYTLYLLNPKPV